MKQTRHKLLYAFLFSGSGVPATLPPECDIVSASSPVPVQAPVSVQRWAFTDRKINLRPEQLLPADYLQQLRTAFGEVRISEKASSSNPDNELHIAILAGEKKVAQVILGRFQRDRHAIAVDDLRLENPLADATAGGVGLGQYSKGLPPEIFRYMRDQLYVIAKAGGYRRLVVAAAENFTVMTLYRRTANMKPAGQTASETIEMLDTLYKYSRKEMPEHLRPQNIQEFTDMLGTASKREDLNRDIENAWDNYRATKTPGPGMQVLKNSKGELMAAVFNEGTPQQKVIFIDTVQVPPRLFRWFDVASSGAMPLIREL